MIVLDGASGLPNKTLGGKTALESASTPNLNKIASLSESGIMHVIGKGIAPQSDAAAYALLGYDPFKIPSRGVTEAIGKGLRFKNGELALRCNFCYVENKKMTKVRIAPIHHFTGKRIEKVINYKVNLDVPFTFKFTIGYRAVLILHGRNLSDQITNTHPGYVRERIGGELVSVAQKLKKTMKIKESKPMINDSRAIYSAELINDFSRQAHEVLNKAGIKDSKGGLINYVLLRDAGNNLPKFKSFYDKYKLMLGMVADMPVELGIAKLLKLEIIKHKNTYEEMAKQVLKELEYHDGLFVHIKGPDKYGHLGDAYGKKKAIEKIDKEFISYLLKNYDSKKHLFCVTCDHSTPAVYGSHSSHPVPVIITSDKPDGTKRFTENECKKGSIGEIIGKELMKKLVKKLQ
jgi:2,3-bisphosphoglycerate-independent phosphoglycerate mutase